VIELEHVPLADGATLKDLSFGEDYELLAAVPSAEGHTAIGRVEAGDGVELLLHGAPLVLEGWEHFT
jgi:thiamine monophosphate kinase